MLKRLVSTTLVTLVAASFTAPASAQSYAGSWSGSYSEGSCASGTEGRSFDRSRSLQVVGLTKDNRLVCFNEF